MRALITGANGFVGRHLSRLLSSLEYVIYGTYLSEKPVGDNSGISLFQCDIRDLARLIAILRKTRPDRIYHLAGMSSPAESFNQLETVYGTNFWGTYNLLEAVRKVTPKARVLVVGSGQCYGPVRPSQLPVTEDHAFAPSNPYALSKAAADMLAGQYHARFGLHIVRARPFNHTGPGQAPEFVCSDFARQIAAIDLGLRPPIVSVGNLEVNRDFTDARDVVRAYGLLLEKAPPGEAYNVASGKTTSIRQILRLLVSFSSRPVRLSIQRQRFRPDDTKTLYGSNRKIHRATGWKPAYGFRTTLHDLYVQWKTALSGTH